VVVPQVAVPLVEPRPDWDDIPTTGAPEPPEENPRWLPWVFLGAILATGLTVVLLILIME